MFSNRNKFLKNLQEIYFGPYDTSKPSEVSGCIDSIDSVRVLGSVSVFQEGKLVLQIRGLKAYRLIQYKKRKAKEMTTVANGKPSESVSPRPKIPDSSVQPKRKIAIGGTQPSEATEQAEPVKVRTTVTATVQEPAKPNIPSSTPSPSTSQSPSEETDEKSQLTVPLDHSSKQETTASIASSSSQFPHIIGFDGNFCLDAHGNASTWDQLKNGRTTNRAVYKNREKIGREAAFIDRDLSLFDPEFFGEIPFLIHSRIFSFFSRIYLKQ